MTTKEALQIFVRAADMLDTKPKTNADKIRAMSDEELAEYLAQLGSDANNGVIFSDRDYEWLEYLQMPWEEE